MGFERTDATQAQPLWAKNYAVGQPTNNEENNIKPLTLEQKLAQNSVFCAYNQ